MQRRATRGALEGLISLRTAQALWAELTDASPVAAVPEALKRISSQPHRGYVLLGTEAVPTMKIDSVQWHLPRKDVARAAQRLCAIEVDPQDLVRVGPASAGTRPAGDDLQALRWREKIEREWSVTQVDPDRARQWAECRLPYLAAIDWRAWLVERGQGEQHTWWLPRAVTGVLDAAEHAEAAWLIAARTCGTCGAVADEPTPGQSDEPPSWRVQVRNGWQTMCPACRTRLLRPYRGELDDSRYSTHTRGRSNKDLSQWLCPLCQAAPAYVLDHCHDHDTVRSPTCQPCNVMERPGYIDPTTVSVDGHFEQLMRQDPAKWLRHWHRCAGCRTRNTLPIAHLAALTGQLLGWPLRPRCCSDYPCSWIQASWTGSPTHPASCTIRVTAMHRGDRESHLLAEVPYEEALAVVRAYMAESVPEVVAAAGPRRHDSAPAECRPVKVDTGEDLSLF